MLVFAVIVLAFGQRIKANCNAPINSFAIFTCTSVNMTTMSLHPSSPYRPPLVIIWLTLLLDELISLLYLITLTNKPDLFIHFGPKDLCVNVKDWPHRNQTKAGLLPFTIYRYRISAIFVQFLANLSHLILRRSLNRRFASL